MGVLVIVFVCGEGEGGWVNLGQINLFVEEFRFDAIGVKQMCVRVLSSHIMHLFPLPGICAVA